MIDPQKYLSLVKQEVGIVAKLDHPFIAKSYGSYENEMRLYTIFEFCSGRELITHSFTEEEARPVIYQVLLALCYLSYKRIVHRDINPQNILFENENKLSSVKLIDFGMAYKFKKNDEGIILSEDITGSPGFTAKEYYCSGQSCFNFQSDIFSVGATLYFMIAGVPIFRGNHLHLISVFNSSATIPFDLPEFSKVSTQGMAFMKKLLDYNILKRPNVQAALKDPWLAPMRMPYTLDEVKSLIAPIIDKIHLYKGFHDPFAHISKLAMVRYLTNKTLGKYIEIFNIIDGDCNGVISLEDVHQICKKIGKDLVEIEYRHYRRKNSVLTYSDFLVSALDKQVFQNIDLIKRAFYLIAQRGEDIVTISSITDAARRLDYNLPGGYDFIECYSLDMYCAKLMSAY
jgi:serine/threonine protein kinase